MADKTEFLQAIDDAILDADSLERFINGSDSETVLTRLSAEYPTLQKAIKQMFENGGLPATPFATKALMEASVLDDGQYAVVTNNTVNNGLYVKTAGSWIKSEFSPVMGLLTSLPISKEGVNNTLNKAISTRVAHQLLKRNPPDDLWDVDFSREGYFISSSNGQYSSFAALNATELVPVLKGDRVEFGCFKPDGNAGTAAGLAFYDVDKGFVRTVFDLNSTTGKFHDGEYVAEDYGYVAASSYSEANIPEGIGKKPYLHIQSEKTVGIQDRLDELDAFRDKLFEDSLDVKSIPFAVDGRYIYYITGELRAHAPMQVTDYIPVNKGDKIQLSVYRGGTNGAGLAFYDKNKEFVESRVWASEDPYTLYEGEEISPIDGFFVAQNLKSGIVNGEHHGTDNPVVRRVFESIQPTEFLKDVIKREVDATILGEDGEITDILVEKADSVIKTAMSDFDLYDDLGRVCVIPENSTIICVGASFASSTNEWFELMCSSLGATGVNKSVAGQGINLTAYQLYSGSLFSSETINSVEAVIFMQVWEYDIVADKNITINGVSYSEAEVDKWGVDDYESKNWDALTTHKPRNELSEADIAALFDYSIKKIKMELYNQKDNPDSAYYNTRHGRPARILMATHWHDARSRVNKSTRLFCKKWGLTLIPFDTNIGFSKTSPHPSGVQESMLYRQDAETINGEQFGWHFIRGQDEEIPRRLAGIAKSCFVVI